ncbi:MAG: hypothetical protein EBY24_13315 [Betaproteobacteria bacterium]|nr:hypothetical protein [Betaproteobacteria bacterium]
MSYEQTKDEVAVFPNNKKTNPQQPDFTGIITFLDGHKLEIALWGRVSKKTGMNFMAGFVQKPFSQRNQDAPAEQLAPPKNNNVQVDF